MTLAVIPARGGSKGIPLKNVVPVAGRPLVAWTIRQALAANRIDMVIVSTDSDEVAAVAEDEGAEVFWRSEQTATDTASTESAVLEVLESFVGLGAHHVGEYTVLLQATSPVRQPHDIDNALQMIEAEQADSLFGGRKVEGYVWRHEVGTGLVPLLGARLPRQQRPETVWEENGSLYVFRTDAFRRERNRLCGRSVVFEMDAFDSYQIDEHDDIARLEQLIRMRLPHVHRHAAAY
jgi:N-acylneuraminate cytidylyltransferase